MNPYNAGYSTSSNPYHHGPLPHPSHLMGPGAPGIAPQQPGQFTAAGHAQSINYGGAQQWNPAQQPPSLGTYGHPKYPQAKGVHPGALVAGSRLPVSNLRGGPAAPMHQSSPREVARKEAAAKVIVEAFRDNTARTVRQNMLFNGADWRATAGPDGRTMPLKELSADNLAELRTGLSETPLRTHEKQFIDNFLKTPLFMTHATNSPVVDPRGNVALFSRKKLDERGIGFQQANTTEDDISALGNDDNVFFSLEAGNTPQKPASRFGQTLLRFEFDKPAITRHALMFIMDPFIVPDAPPPGRFKTLDALPQEHREAIFENLETRLYSPSTCVFQGQDMKIALALAIIRECREMSPDVSRKMLTQESTNHLINTLFRPQIMVPRHFFGRPHDITRIADVR